MNSILYLALHGILSVILAIRIIRLRWKHKVSMGHGDKPDLMAATRVFGNHSEYTPLLLLLLFVSETHGASATFVHTVGIVFTLGRLTHAIGLTFRPNGRSLGRVVGMISTFTSIIACSIYLLMQSKIF